MAYKIGSARIDEKGNAAGGKVGDQKQSSTPDYNGEVSQQTFYVHSQGWRVLRAKSDEGANKIAEAMIRACNNSHIGYDQNRRLEIIKLGTGTATECGCDCSSLVRQCIREAELGDPKNFNTANEAKMILATDQFIDMGNYKKGMKLYTGDILVTCTKGHTVVVTSGTKRSSNSSSTKASSTKTSSSPSKTPQWVGKVTANLLNVRTWAGTENANIKSYPQLRKGNMVDVCDEVKASDGTVWYYIRIEGKYFGFVMSTYIAKV